MKKLLLLTLISISASASEYRNTAWNRLDTFLEVLSAEQDLYKAYPIDSFETLHIYTAKLDGKSTLSAEFSSDKPEEYYLQVKLKPRSKQLIIQDMSGDATAKSTENAVALFMKRIVASGYLLKAFPTKKAMESIEAVAMFKDARGNLNIEFAANGRINNYLSMVNGEGEITGSFSDGDEDLKDFACSFVGLKANCTPAL